MSLIINIALGVLLFVTWIASTIVIVKNNLRRGEENE